MTKRTRHEQTSDDEPANGYTLAIPSHEGGFQTIMAVSFHDATDDDHETPFLVTRECYGFKTSEWVAAESAEAAAMLIARGPIRRWDANDDGVNVFRELDRPAFLRVEEA